MTFQYLKCVRDTKLGNVSNNKNDESNGLEFGYSQGKSNRKYRKTVLRLTEFYSDPVERTIEGTKDRSFYRVRVNNSSMRSGP